MSDSPDVVHMMARADDEDDDEMFDEHIDEFPHDYDAEKEDEDTPTQIVPPAPSSSVSSITRPSVAVDRVDKAVSFEEKECEAPETPPKTQQDETPLVTVDRHATFSPVATVRGTYSTPLSPISPIPLSDAAPDSPKSHSVLTIEHTSRNTTRGAFLWGMSKPAFMGLGFYLLFMTGSAGYFFSRFLRIPGLNDQIDALEVEVDRLEEEINNLEEEVDRLGQEVDRLDVAVGNLTVQNDRFEDLNNALAVENGVFRNLTNQLNASNAEFSDLNTRLNASTLVLEAQVNRLASENDRFQNLTDQLNDTVLELRGEIFQLENTTTQLALLNSQLDQRNNDLLNETTKLESINDELNGTVRTLAQEVTRLDGENQELSQLNNRLTDILGFLNDTVQTTNTTLERVLQVLEENIAASRRLVVESLQNTYSQVVSAWQCDYPGDFAGEPFLENMDQPIGQDNYTSVIGHVDNGVLTPLCLNQTDFELFLDLDFVREGVLPPYGATFTQVRSAVSRYTTAALNHYFPDANEIGVTLQEWDAADYECQSLPSDLLFAS